MSRSVIFNDNAGAANSEPVISEPKEATGESGVSAKAPSEKEQNLEEVRQTLKEIKQSGEPTQKKKKSAADIALRVFQIVFFPITFVIWIVNKIFKKYKVGIAVKSTIIFTLVFGLFLIAYAIFSLVSVGFQLNGDGISTEFYVKFIILSVVLVILFIALGGVIGSLNSRYMINPVKKISKSIEQISEDNLSARLDPVDSQDELMELTEQINSMLDMLQQAFERQENFVSDASHELKTPISVIAGYANLLRRWGKSDPKILDESIEAITRESENMKRLVDQLLWLAKLGKFTANDTIFNLYELVDDIIAGYKLTARHNITLDGDPSVTLNTDKNLMTEAVRTLIDNAIKYSPPEAGDIAVGIHRISGGVELTVSDNGKGISDEDVKHIFERFYRCDKARGRDSGSCGLGLTICKSIVDMMGGKIEVSSKLGEGSTFKITLY